MLAAEAANYALVATIILLAAHVAQLLVKKRRRQGPRVAEPTSAFLQDAAPVLIVFASVTGTTRTLAARLRDALAKEGRTSIVVDASKPQLDPWDELLNGDSKDCAVLVSTVHGGLAPEPSRRLLVEELDDIAADHRVGQGALRGRRFAVLGCGSTAYDPKVFCTPARICEKTLRKLGAARVASTRLDDTEDSEAMYAAWEKRVVSAFSRPQIRGESKARKTIPKVSRVSDSSDNEEAPKKSVTDVEDMGAVLGDKEDEVRTKGPKEMTTPSQAKALKKEGYKLIGSHSAVKLCRWTKHQLRGRGGCYKHTFYGITSYQCMEATPSLACANKCTFCWRHHKNPVATSWKWKADSASMIVAEAVKLHVAMINECKGIPGVLEERWREAHTVRHCALSLVGEPIMYPHINDLIGELHKRQISSFLVTNAQFPDAIRTLRPITQLYVSVDAPNKVDLEEVDRPLFSDAWERLRESLVILREKKQRTVARLTLVKGSNTGDMAGYAELIALGEPTLVEVKGVTFCGKSDASDLTMANCPWHHEVEAFCRELADQIRRDHPQCPVYEVACAHKHSVSVLLARVDQLKGPQGWNTWIDYDRFHELERAYTETGAPFTVQDYAAPCPGWALLGAAEDGFDPTDTRMYKKKANGKSR